MIHTVFKDYIGQKNAIRSLSLSLFSGESNNGFNSIFISAEKGMGKTELAKTYGSACAEILKCKMLWIDKVADFRLEDSPTWADLNSFMTNPDIPGVLVIDECHDAGGAFTRQQQIFWSYVRSALDKQNKGKTFQISSDTFTSFDNKKKVIILMTNHPGKISDAVRDRFVKIDLAPYTDDEMIKITEKMLIDNELTIDANEEKNVVGLIAKASSGTARPIDNLIRHYLVKFNKSVIDWATTVYAMQCADMYPRGLTANEILLLQYAMNKPISPLQIKHTIPGLADTLANSICKLNKYGYISVANNGTIMTTSNASKAGNTKKMTGAGYLAFLKNENFDVPAMNI
jgi:Holliday junction resolvasome RuvABC ATP-dependent DNA helicase subunit